VFASRVVEACVPPGGVCLPFDPPAGSIVGAPVGRQGVGMQQTTWLSNATLNVRTALALGRGAWRLRAGRLPWRSRQGARRHR
jgi:hypothetical protein